MYAPHYSPTGSLSGKISAAEEAIGKQNHLPSHPRKAAGLHGPLRVETRGEAGNWRTGRRCSWRAHRLSGLLSGSHSKAVSLPLLVEREGLISEEGCDGMERVDFSVRVPSFLPPPGGLDAAGQKYRPHRPARSPESGSSG